MPVVRSTASVAASPDEIWALVSDPHHLTRWWPDVQRIEAVTADAFTQVMMTKKGRAMRVDFGVIVSEPPCIRSWELLPAGTPFERVVALWRTTVTLEPDPAGGTLVTIEEQQRMQGTLRLAGVLQRRASRRRLRDALAGLSDLYRDPDSGRDPVA